MLENYDNTATLRPSAEYLEERRVANEEAGKKLDAQRAEVEKANKERWNKHQAELDAGFKANVRAKYSSLANDDFERLWPELRDRELLANAQQNHQQRLADYASQMI